MPNVVYVENRQPTALEPVCGNNKATLLLGGFCLSLGSMFVYVLYWDRKKKYTFR